MAGALGAPSATQASLGPLKTWRIGTDPAKTATPSTWNAHTAKLVTDGMWSYAIYTRFDPPNGYRRISSVYKRRKGSRWRRTKLRISHPHQPPGLALDSRGRLHLPFNCEPPNRTCLRGGYSSGKARRYHHLVFKDTKRDGSVDLGSPDSLKPGPRAVASKGYAGLSTDPSRSGRTFDSLANTEWDQMLFEAGVPKRRAGYLATPGTCPLYPQIAISPTGTRYYAVMESLPRAGDPSFCSPPRLARASVYELGSTNSFRSGPSFSVAEQNPVNDPVFPDNNRSAFATDMSFGPDGRAHFIYFNEAGTTGCVAPLFDTYLVQEAVAGSGQFGDPRNVGCRNPWTQLQVDSRGRLYLVESAASGLDPDLMVSMSEDAGQSWRVPVEIPVPVGAQGMPPGSQGIIYPTLVKDWTSPNGYDPDVLRGFVSNSAELPEGRRSWSANEFAIPILP